MASFKFTIIRGFSYKESKKLLKLFMIMMIVFSGMVLSTPSVFASALQDGELSQVVILNTRNQPLQGATVQILIVPQRTFVTTKQPLRSSGTDGVRGLVQQPVVGTGSTDSQGRVHTTLNSPSPDDTTSMSPDGYVNYELRVLDSKGSWLLDYHFTRYYGHDRDLTNGVTPLQGKRLIANTSLAQIVSQQTGPNGPGPGCGWTNTGRYWNTYTVIGELNTVPQMEARFDYGQTADSNIGVEFSQSADGGYSVSGTSHVSSSDSAKVSQYVSASNKGWGYQLLSSFHYVQQREYCAGVPLADYQIIPTDWNGGLITGNSVYGNDNHKNKYTTSYGPGGSFTRDTNSAYTYGGTACIFVCVTAQSGFATDVDAFWKNDSTTSTHYLYGNNDFPTRSTIIYASS